MIFIISILRGYHRTLTESLSVLGHTDPNIYPFSDLFHDYQEAIIPAVGVAVTVLPGLVKESSDEVDLGDDRPGIAAGRLVADKIMEAFIFASVVSHHIDQAMQHFYAASDRMRDLEKGLSELVQAIDIVKCS